MKDKKDTVAFIALPRKAKKLTTPQLDFKTTPGLISALRNPAINVRALAFEGLKAKGEEAVPEVKALASSGKSFPPGSRRFGLLAQMGEKGKAEVVQITFITRCLTPAYCTPGIEVHRKRGTLSGTNVQRSR